MGGWGASPTFSVVSRILEFVDRTLGCFVWTDLLSTLFEDWWQGREVVCVWHHEKKKKIFPGLSYGRPIVGI